MLGTLQKKWRPKRKKMFTRSQVLESGDPVLEIKYFNPQHDLSPRDAFMVAKDIREKYMQLRQSKTQDSTKAFLLNDPKIAHFASEACFPTLFNMACSDEDCLNAVETLVSLREAVNSGLITEQSGAESALLLAAQQKQSKQ